MNIGKIQNNNLNGPINLASIRLDYTKIEINPHSNKPQSQKDTNERVSSVTKNTLKKPRQKRDSLQVTENKHIRFANDIPYPKSTKNVDCKNKTNLFSNTLKGTLRGKINLRKLQKEGNFEKAKLDLSQKIQINQPASPLKPKKLVIETGDEPRLSSRISEQKITETQEVDLDIINTWDENDELLPLKPKAAIYRYKEKLTEFERQEILNFEEIYYIGADADKIDVCKSRSDLGYKELESLYDDNGDYQARIKDHIAYRFEIIDRLGKGSFGEAFKCFDHKKKELIAIKIIRNNPKFED